MEKSKNYIGIPQPGDMVLIHVGGFEKPNWEKVINSIHYSSWSGQDGILVEVDKKAPECIGGNKTYSIEWILERRCKNKGRIIQPSLNIYSNYGHRYKGGQQSRKETGDIACHVSSVLSQICNIHITRFIDTKMCDFLYKENCTGLKKHDNLDWYYYTVSNKKKFKRWVMTNMGTLLMRKKDFEKTMQTSREETEREYWEDISNEEW